MKNKIPAHNKRFGEIGVKVIARTSARPLTVSDNPNGVQSIPNCAKPPGRWLQAGESVGEKDVENRNLVVFVREQSKKNEKKM